ncbi:cell envelope integrity protein CreD [Erythrobacter sp. YT30]|uniref:cell envelope integrity protein CreD n=1 Tax=Erythrobacter sp. YT30 TaxID=1735012 RepID=UPI00076C74A4|nr:cell envelope integrity protein CreD [Erythrobacter sp. YT30]KWV93125.1 colicin resistance protein [Erythrobacter sp. YT30]
MVRKERSPGVKLLLAGLVGLALIIPLAMVYMLVSDRQHQARIAQNSIEAGWAGSQTIAGPMLVVPYTTTTQSTEEVNGKTVTRSYQTRRNLFIAAQSQSISTNVDPEKRSRGAIYETIVYDAQMAGEAQFALPGDLDKLGIEPDELLLDEAFIQLSVSDPKGLQTDARLSVDGEAIELNPGLGPDSTGSGVHAFFDWTGAEPIALDFGYSLRGSTNLSFVPRGQATEWSVTSSWPHPSFSGGFLPGDEDKEVSADGFKAKWSISNLALGQSLVTIGQPDMPSGETYYDDGFGGRMPAPGSDSIAAIGFMEPVDLYKQVERALKYGFLFIGFTFLAFLMFDVVAGARVASAEYLLTGAGLILFFVMLLAFAELIGFAAAYTVSSGAIIGLLTTYSAAVLKSWKRAGLIGGMLLGLYAVLYVLLNLEAWSLVIGSVMLFAALAGVMYATRNIDWTQVRVTKQDEEVEA